MSTEAVVHVFATSPYKHDQLLVHLALADRANAKHGWLIWESHREIAARARTSLTTVEGALRQMVKDGAVEVVEEPAGKPKVYRFIVPSQCLLAPSDSETLRIGETAREVTGIREGVSQIPEPDTSYQLKELNSPLTPTARAVGGSPRRGSRADGSNPRAVAKRSSEARRRAGEAEAEERARTFVRSFVDQDGTEDEFWSAIGITALNGWERQRASELWEDYRATGQVP